MKKFLAAVFALFLALSAAPAFSYHWVEVDHGHFIDTDSIKRKDHSQNYPLEGRFYQFWAKLVAHRQPLKFIQGRPVWTAHINAMLDCQNKTIKHMAYYAYDADNQPIVSERLHYEPWEPITLGPNSTVAYEFICSGDYNWHEHHHHHYYPYFHPAHWHNWRY